MFLKKVDYEKNLERMQMKYIAIIMSLFTLFSCNSDELQQLKKANAELTEKYKLQQNELQAAAASASKLRFIQRNLQGITATLQTTAGNIDVKFYPEVAPLTVYSFILRAEGGFYNNTKFHRVIENFMIQGGDPNSRDGNPLDDGRGGPVAAQPHEFNDIKHVPGILSTARTNNLSAGAGSQFFIMHGQAPTLDTQYTVFGEVTRGMDIVNKIATAAKRNNPRDYPVDPVMIKNIVVRR
jgi:peptidyl-prolyl cis-trans isomerase B (cyclophilin B)